MRRLVLSEHLCQGWLEGYLLTGRLLPEPEGRRHQRGRPHAASALSEYPHGMPDVEFDTRLQARAHTREHGEDAPEIRDCIWTSPEKARPGDQRHTPRSLTDLDVMAGPTPAEKARETD
ncbi:hypothetical protein [Nonomuraea sp. NPDC049784]|uniref:hypothetical protein n=1 Tax=Nonomuraea sp. NPDC049784 TaxID=3154361 RepID=UPI0033E50CB4